MQNPNDYLDYYLTNFSCFTRYSCYAILTFFNRGGTVFSDGFYIYRNI